MEKKDDLGASMKGSIFIVIGCVLTLLLSFLFPGVNRNDITDLQVKVKKLNEQVENYSKETMKWQHRYLALRREKADSNARLGRLEKFVGNSSRFHAEGLTDCRYRELKGDPRTFVGKETTTSKVPYGPDTCSRRVIMSMCYSMAANSTMVRQMWNPSCPDESMYWCSCFGQHEDFTDEFAGRDCVMQYLECKRKGV